VPTFNEAIIDEFRAHDGVVGGSFEGRSMLLLTTVGRRSGQPRTTPLVYSTTDDDGLVVVASNGGSDRDPLWYRNLLANPHATVEAGTHCFTVRATFLDGEDRQRLLDHHTELMPGFRDYVAQTDRVLPVVVLHRALPPGVAEPDEPVTDDPPD
jgi:deazaflavin-dependent oxidoreductase (nitroreductase family)